MVQVPVGFGLSFNPFWSGSIWPHFSDEDTEYFVIDIKLYISILIGEYMFVFIFKKVKIDIKNYL